MDKKILLGGAAALLLVGNMYATPASASIDLSIGGEAKLTATMPDACFTAQASDSLNVALGDSDLGDGLAGATITITEAVDGDGAVANIVSYAADPCSGNSEDEPVWGFGKELSISASGTLANGLSVAFSDKLDLTDIDKEQGSFELELGGAFGTLTFADGVKSAVDAAMVGDTSGADVSGLLDLGGHKLSTDGTDGTGILYQAPTMGSLDLYVSYAPNSEDNGYDTAKYLDTFAFGVTFSTDNLTIGGGFESASENNNACDLGTTLTLADVAITAAALFDDVYGTDHCGDQSLMAVGAEFVAADMTFSAAYSELDTDEADQTSYSFGVSTTISDFDLAIDYTNSVNEFANDGIEDEQSVIHVGLATALGDGVDLSLDISTNDQSVASEANGGGHGGDLNQTYAELALTVGF